MATRYCGRVKINCVYRDREDDYRCSLSVGGKRRGTVHVGAPRSKSHAVDAPEAYDSTAHAAISFALADGLVDESDCDFTGSGNHIRRATRKRRKG